MSGGLNESTTDRTRRRCRQLGRGAFVKWWQERPVDLGLVTHGSMGVRSFIVVSIGQQSTNRFQRTSTEGRRGRDECRVGAGRACDGAGSTPRDDFQFVGGSRTGAALLLVKDHET